MTRKKLGVHDKMDTSQRLAVLPLANLGDASNEEYFADGMTDELITVLSRLPGLKVIARTSMMRYSGTKKPIAQIGSELGVASIIEGTVLRSQDRVRISVQLIDAATEEHIWADRYDRRLGDVFEIQSAIAKQVARELRIRLTGRFARPGPRTGDVDVHTLYLRARYQWNRRSEEGVGTAISQLEETIRKDPEFSPAITGLADCYSVSALFGYAVPKEAFARAKELALRALKAGGAAAEAHTSLAEVLMHYEFDWAGAARELERSLRISPNYPTAHMWRSTCYAAIGQLDNAIVEAERTLELDPFAVVAMNEVAKDLYYAQRYGEAIKQFRYSLEIEPESAYLHKGLAETYAQESMTREAVQEIERALVISGRSPFYLDSSACVYALSNEEQKAREVLAEADRVASKRFVPLYGRAGAYAVLGEKEKALQLLRAAYDQRSWIAWLNVDPIFDSLRNEDGFHLILQRMNLERVASSENSSGTRSVVPVTLEAFEFESQRSGIVFQQLASDFIKDYMSLSYMEEKSGWRSVGDIAKETGIPLSSFYSNKGVPTPLTELLKRGIIEMRISPGERGRGGQVAKFRVAYSKIPVRNHVDKLTRAGKK